MKPWWVKIGDFGISKRIKAEDATELRTEAGAIGYQAPEVRGLVIDTANQGSSIYTNAVDIWSLGCVIYKIVTKKVPFQSSTDLRGFCDSRILFPSMALEGKMSEEGIEFLESLLKPQPLHRPTAAQASHHNWLKFEGILDDVILDASEMQYDLPPVGRDPHKTIEIIKFKDAVGREFSWPFALCKTWAVSSIAFSL
jgi:serine/threonine protein kinase